LILLTRILRLAESKTAIAAHALRGPNFLDGFLEPGTYQRDEKNREGI
jgi:hypothetical protein